ncbi:MAG: HlyD family secretion protein [Burkholderiales bacterium]|nr:MAG: HlyD family secretion protein [Burkholderiales bacterium]
MKLSRTAWIIAALLVLASVAGWWWLQRSDASASIYRTAKIVRGALQAAVSATGTVTPVAQVQVSSQVSGQIRDLFVDFNSEVKQGQLIAQLDPQTFEYRVRQAEADVEASRASVLTAQANVQSALAQLSRARVDLADAQRDLDRKQDLLARNFISPAEIDTARSKVDALTEATKAADAQVAVARAQAGNAEATVRQRQAQLSQARVDLGRTDIRSPVDGIVIKRSIEIGQTVAASLQAPELFVIARNLQDMQVEAAIDEADISRVRVGQAVPFTIDAFPGRTFDGSVRQVRKAATSTQNVVTYTVVVGFANPGSLLLPGMTANVRIITDTRDSVLKVPNAALRVRIAGVEPPPAASAPLTPPPADVPPGTAPGGAGGRGGAMAELRNRLLAELQLSAAQTEQIEAVFAANRARLAQLRNLPEDERPKARERMLANLRAQIGEQLTPEQRSHYQALLAELGGRQTTRGRLYLVDEGGRPKAVDVRLGITDGTTTEIVVPAGSPAAALLKEGAEVITAVLGAQRANSGMPRMRFGF